jgi:glyoxylase-like metal-dependent hydrolase (beta-lactamase superfamily II)
MALLFGCLVMLSTASLSQEILDAVRTGDLAKVKPLVEKDPQLVNARNPNGQTILFAAVMSCSPEIIEYLISKGADVNARDGFYMTPLLIACRSGLPLATIRLLVEKGADVNSVAKYLGKPLDLAYENGDPAVTQYLTSKGAGFTPSEFETFRLTDNIHRIAFPWGMRNNLIVLSGKDGSLIVDTGFSKRSLETLKKTIAGFAGGDIKYVINTHSNWDHVVGNALAPSEAAILGFQKLTGGELRGIAIKSDKSLTGRSGLTLPAPYTMKFNGENIALIPYPGLHSPDDILIHFPKSNVVCMGDLLLSQSCPAIRNVAGYMELLEKVIDVFPAKTRFVSGHGRDLTAVGLKKYRNNLAEMIAIVKKNYAAGKTVEDMIRDDILKAYKDDYSQLDWLGPDAWLGNIVRYLQSDGPNSIR